MNTLTDKSKDYACVRFSKRTLALDIVSRMRCIERESGIKFQANKGWSQVDGKSPKVCVLYGKWAMCELLMNIHDLWLFAEEGEMRFATLDDKPNPLICDCEFSPNPDSDEEPWHYLRRCQFCNHTWYGLHCPHDGHQNPCMGCDRVPEVVHPTEIL